MRVCPRAWRLIGAKGNFRKVLAILAPEEEEGSRNLCFPWVLPCPRWEPWREFLSAERRPEAEEKQWLGGKCPTSGPDRPVWSLCYVCRLMPPTLPGRGGRSSRGAP